MQTNHQAWPLPLTTLKPALELALAIEHAPMGILMLTSENADGLEPVVAEGLTDDQTLRFNWGRPGEAPFRLAFNERRRVTIADVLHDGQGAHMRDTARRLGFRALDVFPLTLDDGRAIGALAALFRTAHIPSAREVQLAEQCGRLVALALDNARLRTEAERRREMAESMSRARVEYVAKLAHELRTPLQSITGYLELLRLDNDHELSPRQSDMCERASACSAILIRAIGDLGTMARLEAGRLDYLIVPVPVGQAIATAVAVIAPLAHKKNVYLTFPPDSSLLVMADDMKLKQILVNLMANAVKFTPPGGRVRIAARAEGRTVRFDVSDNGPGIPEDQIETVFQPFVQLASLATPGNGLSGIAGSGLGLAISREFAAGMHGDLTATSSPGAGAVFTLRLPKS